MTASILNRSLLLRLLLAVIFLFLHACGDSSPANDSLPAIALTFDEHPTTYSAVFPIMRSRGLVGTFFVSPNTLENGTLAKHQLREMEHAGWSIQAYSGDDMVKFLVSHGSAATRARLIEIRDRMQAHGFSVTALAAGGCQWNDELRDLAKGIFNTVRVATGGIPQEYPFSDPLYVKNGATGSLSGNDTVEGLTAMLDSHRLPKHVKIFMFHKIGDNDDPMYSIPLDTFSSFSDHLARKVADRQVRVITIR